MGLFSFLSGRAAADRMTRPRTPGKFRFPAVSGDDEAEFDDGYADDYADDGLDGTEDYVGDGLDGDEDEDTFSGYGTDPE